MKKILLFVFSCVSLSSFAQKIDFSMSAGTGNLYIIESMDNSVNVNYSIPLSFMSELKYTPNNKSWGIKLRYHNMESSITGDNWENNSLLDGYVSSNTTSLLLEDETHKGKFSYGFNFGLGITKETIQPQQFQKLFKTESRYASFILGGHITLKMSESFDFQIQPIFNWHDPYNSIAYLSGRRMANLAGEDLSVLINFGVRYRVL